MYENCRFEDFSGQNLSTQDLSFRDYEGSEFGNSSLVGTIFRGSRLVSCSFRGADLRSADLSQCSLRNADFRGADCRDANFHGSIMHSTNLQSADLRGADLTNAHFAGPDGDHRANVTNADLRNARFTKESDSRAEGSFLDLGMCIGLDQEQFDSPDFLSNYFQSAFEYAHRADIPERVEYPMLVSAAVSRLRFLMSLFDTEDPPTEVIRVCDEISAELIRHLQEHPQALDSVHPRQFELLIAELLARFGWRVELTPAQKDGGFDIFGITKDIAGVRSSWIIECKKYREDRKVGVGIARAVYAVKGDLRVSNALLVTSSYFTKGVIDFKASRYDLELRDLAGVVEWINKYRPNPNGRLYMADNRLVIPSVTPTWRDTT